MTNILSQLKVGEYGFFEGVKIGISYDSIGYTGKSKSFILY